MQNLVIRQWLDLRLGNNEDSDRLTDRVKDLQAIAIFPVFHWMMVYDRHHF